MQFDLARQPLVPAFLTLLALAAGYLCTLGPLAGPETPFVAGQGMALPLPGELLLRFQSAWPGWSKLLVLLAILFSGMTLGRMTVRYNLYSVGTCLPIPLFAIVACGIGTGAAPLPGFTVALLGTLAVKNFSRAFRNGYGFDALFRGALYLGVLILTTPAALPSVLLLPLALLLFGRTSREAVVAGAGLLLAPLLFCYVNWGLGGDFCAPLTTIGERLLTGTPLGFIRSLPPLRQGLAGFILVLNLAAILRFLADIYAAGTKQRFMLFFHIGSLALALAALCGPAASAVDAALPAIPSTLLIPFLLIRIRTPFATAIYLLLLSGTVAALALPQHI